MRLAVIGVPTQTAGTVAIICNQCGPVGEVAYRYGALRVLAHYHAHQKAEV
jgi:hypothetical protein